MALICFQICAHHGIEADPDYPAKNFEDRELVGQIADFIRRRLPDVEDTPSLIEHCFYTVRIYELSLQILWRLATDFLVNQHSNESHPLLLFVQSLKVHVFLSFEDDIATKLKHHALHFYFSNLGCGRRGVGGGNPNQKWENRNTEVGRPISVFFQSILLFIFFPWTKKCLLRGLSKLKNLSMGNRCHRVSSLGCVTFDRGCSRLKICGWVHLVQGGGLEERFGTTKLMKTLEFALLGHLRHNLGVKKLGIYLCSGDEGFQVRKNKTAAILIFPFLTFWVRVSVRKGDNGSCFLLIAQLWNKRSEIRCNPWRENEFSGHFQWAWIWKDVGLTLLIWWRAHRSPVTTLLSGITLCMEKKYVSQVVKKNFSKKDKTRHEQTKT